MKKLFYYSELKDAAENSIRIEIYKDSETGVSAENLLLSSDAVQIESDTESLFSPVKVSALTVNVLTKSILTHLYTAEASEVSAKVYKNGVLLWFGYLSPNVYSSDYVNETNILSLEFVDTLAQMDFFKYRYIQDNTSNIQSFYSIITSILDRIDPEKVINEIYLSNSIQVNGENDVLRKMMIQERNFFDEANEAETCKNVINEIVKYLSMTMIQYENKYLMLDYEALKSGNNKFVKYNRSTGATEVVTLAINEVNINQNIYEANATVSLGEVYNKIVVIGNNNPVSNLIPELFNDEDLKNQNADKNKYYEKEQTINNEVYTLLSAYFESKENWNVDTTIDGKEEEIKEVTIDNINTIYKGSFFQKVANYKNDEGEPSSLNWSTYLTMHGAAEFSQTVIYGKGFIPKLSVKKTLNGIYSKGYLIANIKYKYSTHIQANNCLEEPEQLYKEGKYTIPFSADLFPCHLSIGNKWFDGDKWRDKQEHENKVARNYYKKVIGPTTSVNAHWYYYIDEYGYKRFVTKTEYDALPSSTVKENGGYDEKNSIYFFKDENNKEIYTTQDFFFECLLKDKFLLVHKNHVDNKIFGIEKELTNTVSYKLNLIDSKDGVAIPMPQDQIVEGSLKFELWTPMDLGKVPQVDTDSNTQNYCNSIHISDLSLIYTTDKYAVDIFSKEKYDADIKFENVVNEDFVNDFDDLELRVNTYSEKAGSYSYVIEKIGDKYDYITNTLNLNTNDKLKQEEHIITKYYDYFSYPKYIYSNTLVNADIKPYSLLYENTLGKNFFLNKWIMNLSDNSIEVTANEV
ncbi:hypothetical protein [Phocaeicola sp.]